MNECTALLETHKELCASCESDECNKWPTRQDEVCNACETRNTEKVDRDTPIWAKWQIPQHRNALKQKP